MPGPFSKRKSAPRASKRGAKGVGGPSDLAQALKVARPMKSGRVSQLKDKMFGRSGANKP